MRRMPARWKVKASAQSMFSRLPAGHRINMVFQRATGGLPISDAAMASSRELATHHLDAIARHSDLDITTATFFEFGAGFDLHMPLLFRALGVRRQIVVDIRPLARPALVRDIVERLRRQFTDGVVPLELDPWTDPFLTYLEHLGVEYRAPGDARDTRLPAGSVAAVTSTNTLEHIPPADIAAIYAECRRIIDPNGILSFQIDYSDHYSHFDQSLSPYNFLQYEDREWRRYNNDLHFQNRLRHRDHVALVEAAGFEIVECQTTTGTPSEREALSRLHLASPFAGRPLDELAILTSRMVLRPA
jgi:hypothetical protein